MGLNSEFGMTDLINSGATINVEEKSPPDECQYVVRWRTQYGCPYGGGYAKVSQGTFASGGGGGSGGGSWFMWLVTMLGYLTCGLLVLIVVLCVPVLRKRVSQ